MPYITTLTDGKPQVNKEVAFCYLLENVLPNQNQSIIELLEHFDKQIKVREPRVTTGSLSNVRGDWYEWLLAIAAWNYCAENVNANLPLLTPNVTQLDITSLYNPKLYDLILDLKEKIHLSSSVRLISSNPDFVIIDRKVVNKFIPVINKIEVVDTNSIHLINHTYQLFIGSCNFDQIIGYISVKTSFRPDRRLQIPHEGSLMKALYIHLQTREWIINPKGIKYYAMATEVKKPDRHALKTVATHSITTVHSVPEAAVDEVFQVNSLSDAHNVFEQILNA